MEYSATLLALQHILTDWKYQALVSATDDEKVKCFDRIIEEIGKSYLYHTTSGVRIGHCPVYNFRVCREVLDLSARIVVSNRE